MNVESTQKQGAYKKNDLRLKILKTFKLNKLFKIISKLIENKSKMKNC